MIPAIDVYTTCAKGQNEVLVGKCSFNLRRGKISTVFSYADAYLKKQGAFAIDPQAPLRLQAYHFSGLPGCMRDSLPDRWGRHLITRRNIEGAQVNTGVKAFDDVDFLVGVSDIARQGALRFTGAGSSEKLSSCGAIPPVMDLKQLVSASNSVIYGDASFPQIKELLDAGSGSLGGARPKAAVVDHDKLLLAKFPHPGDEWDVMAWEKTALDVAAQAGCCVPKTRLVKIGNNSVLILERFDRGGAFLNGFRIPYLSAMSLLNATDGEQHDYLELVESMLPFARNAKTQLVELFRRIVLSVVLHNTDDHLRNIGFIYDRAGWIMSPAFDININPDLAAGRVTPICGECGKNEAYALKEFADLCEIDSGVVREVVAKVVVAAMNIKGIAQKNKCAGSEIAFMTPVVYDRAEDLKKAFDLQ